MALFEILFILAGFFVGLVSRGGMSLFLLPLAMVAFVLAQAVIEKFGGDAMTDVLAAVNAYKKRVEEDW